MKIIHTVCLGLFVSVVLAQTQPAASIQINLPQGNPITMIWVEGNSDAILGFERDNISVKTNPFFDPEPPHRRAIKTFLLSETEITIAHFAAFLADNEAYIPQATAAGESEVLDIESSKLVPRAGVDWRCDVLGAPVPRELWAQYPVAHVSARDARAFCTWLYLLYGEAVDIDFRLPTNDEWEYAAGNGPQHTYFSWGNEAPRNPAPENLYDWQAKILLGATSDEPAPNQLDDGYPMTAPIKRFPPNTLGFYDISGNLNEFCSDDPYSSGHADMAQVAGNGMFASMGLNTVACFYSVWQHVTNGLTGFRIAFSIE